MDPNFYLPIVMNTALVVVIAVVIYMIALAYLNRRATIREARHHGVYTPPAKTSDVVYLTVEDVATQPMPVVELVQSSTPLFDLLAMSYRLTPEDLTPAH